ncbi:MAG TPA: hypothetical protein DCY74_01960 [Clostridiales bacterium]|jgi:hypothetical protein|nr:hypothetical protein [Clostridiales bacterium]HCG35568.1 hypothetical protein [Clostridiales bacterium]
MPCYHLSLPHLYKRSLIGYNHIYPFPITEENRHSLLGKNSVWYEALGMYPRKGMYDASQLPAILCIHHTARVSIVTAPSHGICLIVNKYI